MRPHSIHGIHYGMLNYVSIMSMSILFASMLKSLPRVKNFSSRAEWEKAAWENFVEQLSVLKSSAAVKIVLDLTTSIHERRTILLRAATLTRLHAGESYRTIGRELWVSPQLISAIRKAVKKRSYESNWRRAKEQRIQKQRARIRARDAKPDPIVYRNTKYGRRPLP